MSYDHTNPFASHILGERAMNKPTAERIMYLADAYAREAEFGNEYDNRRKVESARKELHAAVTKALGE